MDSVYYDQERIGGLKRKLLDVAVELEGTRFTAEDGKRRNDESDESVESLVRLLKNARKERDEALDLLEQLSKKLVHSNQVGHTYLPHLTNMALVPSKGNHYIDTQYDEGLYEAFDQQVIYDYGSSTVNNSFFDSFPSQESSENMSLHRLPVLRDDYQSLNIASETAEGATAAFDELIRGKALPQKGRLLDAVSEAGPLLETLLLVGNLPQWHNPPPL